MYTYDFLIQSERQAEMTSFDALVYPCDKYVWYATFSMALAMFFALVVIQKTWLHATGEKQPNGWIFQGI